METIPINGGKGALELRPDGVLHLRWSPKVSLGEADIRAAVAKVNDACRSKARPLLVEMSNLDTVSHEARSVFSEPGGGHGSHLPYTLRTAPNPSRECTPAYTRNMPITRLDRGFHAQPSALEQYGSDL